MMSVSAVVGQVWQGIKISLQRPQIFLALYMFYQYLYRQNSIERFRTCRACHQCVIEKVLNIDVFKKILNISSLKSLISYTFLSSNPEWMKIGKVFSRIEYWEQTCMFPATVITLNPINPSAFSTTKGDASARNLNKNI